MTHHEGDLFATIENADYCSKITSVGGDCFAREGAALPALTSVGGDCLDFKLQQRREVSEGEA